jgi:presenilin-like A22 family membrane protease
MIILPKGLIYIFLSPIKVFHKNLAHLGLHVFDLSSFYVLSSYKNSMWYEIQVKFALYNLQLLKKIGLSQKRKRALRSSNHMHSFTSPTYL